MSTKVLSTPIEGAPVPFEPFQFTPQKIYSPTTDGLIEFINETLGLMEAVADTFVENHLAISRD